MKHIFRFTLALLILLPAAAQKPKKKKKEPQYKRHSWQAMTNIAKGKTKDAIKHYRDYLEDAPEDLESFYGLALAYTQQGDLDMAMKQVRLAHKHGLPITRFLAGPREFSDKLTQSKGWTDFREETKDIDTRLLHGPMVGDITAHSSRIWVRTDVERKVEILVGEQTFTARTQADDDFTAVILLSNLTADVEHVYRIHLDGKGVDPGVATKFTTFACDRGQLFDIAFGGGAGYTPWKEYMWDTIGKHKPDALLLLGDNVYHDQPEVPTTQEYCYYRRQSQPAFRRLTATTPTYTVWDDHDFGVNDCAGGPDPDKPTWKRPVLKVYNQNWPNPPTAATEEIPGIWYSFRLGAGTDAAEFFMLDTRYYREVGKSMLGPTQLAWLLDSLKKSDATFKVICSSVPMSTGTKPGSKDTWDGHKAERETIFEHIETEKIPGVFVLAADRHRSDHWITKRPGAYDLHEFMSSRLTNIHVHQIMPASVFGYNETCSFGLVRFDFTKDDPTATYTIRSIDDELVYSVTLKASSLVAGP